MENTTQPAATSPSVSAKFAEPRSSAPSLWALSLAVAINNKFELGMSNRELTWTARLIENHSTFVFALGEKPPMSAESNARTKKSKLKKQRQLARLREFHRVVTAAVGDREGAPTTAVGA